VDGAVARPPRFRDPLLERDYVRICSRPSSFRSRTLAAGLIAAAAGIVLIADRGERPDVIGFRLHGVYAVVGAIVAAWMTLSEAATAIPAERSAGTLPLLLATPLSTRRLAAGFLGSRIAFAGTVLIALLPIEGLSLILGGVSGTSVLLANGTIAMAAAWAGGVGLLASAGAAESRRGLGAAIALGLCWLAVVPLLLGFAGFLLSELPGLAAWRAEGEILAKAAGALAFSTPAGAVVAQFRPIEEAFDVPRWALFAVPAAVAFAVCVAGVLAAARRLGREADAQAVAGARAASADAARPARRPRGPGRDPLAWKESRPPRSLWARLAFHATTLVWLALLSWLWFHEEVREGLRRPGGASTHLGFYDYFISTPLWMLLLGAAVSSATLVAEEREKGALDLLRTTPLEPADYALARARAVARRLAPGLAVSAVFAVIGVFMGIIRVATLATWLAGFALVAPAIVLGFFALGSRAATVRSATRNSALLVVTLLVVWPIATALLACIPGMRDAHYLAMMNPLAGACGPFILYASSLEGPADLFRLERVLPLVAAVGWGIVGFVLWTRRRGIVDRAFHGPDA
jgi:hypothetical protein